MALCANEKKSGCVVNVKTSVHSKDILFLVEELIFWGFVCIRLGYLIMAICDKANSICQFSACL